MLIGMVKLLASSVCLLALGACVSPEVQAARERIAAACEAGDVDACVALRDGDAQRRQAIGAAISNAGNNYANTMRPRQTTCRSYYGEVTCNGY